MKKNTASLRSAALCLLCALLVLFLPLKAHAAASSASGSGGQPVVTAYRAENNGRVLSSFTKGDKVTITVSLKDTSVTTDQIPSAENLDVTHLLDSFTGGSVTAAITSQGNQPLTYDITVRDLTYGGSGKLLRLMIGYPGVSSGYETVELTVTEAAEPAATEKETVPAPMVVVSRSDIPTPLTENQDVNVVIFFRNLSDRTLFSPVAAITPSDSLMIAGGSASFPMSNIAPYGTGSLTISLRTLEKITAASQSLGVELRFNYDNNITMTQGTFSDRVSLPATVTKDPVKVTNPQPPIQITRSAMKDPIAAKQTADVTIYLKNVGTVAASNAVVTFTPSDVLTLLNDTSTFVFDSIAPGQVCSVTLHLKAGKEITSSNQSVSVDLKFSYDSGEGSTQATVSDRVNLSSKITPTITNGTQIDSQVPNLIVTEFSFGKKKGEKADSVAAGDSFFLTLTFSNTGKRGVENIVATVDGGESFTMNASSNTFYYTALPAGGTQTLEIPMTVMNSAKTGAQVIGINFKYEYVDATKRSQATADIKLSLPVYQPDRFQVNAPAVPETVNAGEEVMLSLAYVNKGKGDVANMEATLEGDVETSLKTQYLGNCESGKSGTIGFSFTPLAAGDTSIVLKLTYENSNQQVKTLEFPVTLHVIEAVPATDDPTVPDPEIPAETSAFPWKWVGIGGGAALFAAILLIVLLKKRKKKTAQAAETAWDNWDDIPVDTGKR